MLDVVVITVALIVGVWMVAKILDKFRDDE